MLEQPKDVGAEDESLDSVLMEAVCGVNSSHDTRADLEEGLPEFGSTVAGRYRIESLLGRGGMGTVFAGRHLLTGKRVAIKWLRGDPARRKDASARMAREARAAGRIHHPNVVDVYDAGFVGERPFIVMELLEGESLEQRLARGPLSVKEALTILLPVLRGVAAAHALGIVHRDLKPANIFLCRAAPESSVVPKVLDFGISKLALEANDDLTITGEGVQLGTPVFMAPEQVRGDEIDARTDVYALSVTLYLMLTQEFPFRARTRQELFAKILTERPTPIERHRSDLPRSLITVIMQGLAREPDRRIGSVSELLTLLGPFAEGGAIPRRPARMLVWLGRRERRPYFLSVTLGLLCVLALSWLAARAHDPPRPTSERSRSSGGSAHATPSLQIAQPAATGPAVWAPSPNAEPDEGALSSTRPDASISSAPRRADRVPRSKPRDHKERRKGQAQDAALPGGRDASRPIPSGSDKFMSW